MENVEFLEIASQDKEATASIPHIPLLLAIQPSYSINNTLFKTLNRD